MTIDQLLADVSPLLPVCRTRCELGFYYRKTKRGRVSELAEDEYEIFNDYCNHAANHFPAMLQALRHITMVLHVANGRLAEAGMDNYEETVDFAKQAIAAASEVGG